MPLIQAPAHEFDTLNTVVQRCMYIADHNGQFYVVIHVYQALYYKLMELKWIIAQYRERLIVGLVGLHISMVYLLVIGNHMKGSGLIELWVEAGILGQHTVEKFLTGKLFNKGVRSHKLTLHALWKLLGHDLLNFINSADCQLHKIICDNIKDFKDASTLVEILSDEQFSALFHDFIDTKEKENVNFAFWWGYMEMVSILLMFIRAQRDGFWELHLQSFRSMLPFFLRYDHYN